MPRSHAPMRLSHALMRPHPFLGGFAFRHRLQRGSCSFLGECRQLQLGQLCTLPPLEKHRRAEPGHRNPLHSILPIEVSSRGDYRRASAGEVPTRWRPDLVLYPSSHGLKGCSFEPRRERNPDDNHRPPRTDERASQSS
jgi:hypothetical protein